MAIVGSLLLEDRSSAEVILLDGFWESAGSYALFGVEMM
jgi:hypothetical protein